MEDEMLTDVEAAAYLKVDVITVQRALRRGALRGKQIGRAWRLSRTALREYVAGSDPVLGMARAATDFRMGNFEAGLRTLHQNLVSFNAPEGFASEGRRDKLQKLMILEEAFEKRSPQDARAAMCEDGDLDVGEHRSSASGMLGATVTWNDMWNIAVDCFISGLEERKPKPKAKAKAAKA